MKILSLDGRWVLRQCDAKVRSLYQLPEAGVTANVPGDALTTLVTSRILPDPFHRENEDDVQWVGECAWVYEREFTVSAALLTNDCIMLQCDGLDTFAAVHINGKKVAQTHNMHCRYEWDVRKYLKSGKNAIAITFSPVNEYTRKRHKETPFRARVGESHPSAYPGWVRKEACNFGWDWGPILVTCGIWRSIRLAAFSEGRISDIKVGQVHGAGQVKLGVDVAAEGVSRKSTVRVTVSCKGKAVAVKSAVVARKTHIDIVVKNPQLWWPNNMGAQPLYDVGVELIAPAGSVVDHQARRIGLRTLRLDRHKDEWGESFQFVVNGVPFFAKGANWIPADALLGRRNPELYRGLIEDAAAANMNMLRVWGGGIYEDDCFYQYCDELGICVWQDFMFACMSYPSFDRDFMKTVAAEAEDNVRRLRHHACLALWCGNNELEQQAMGKDNKWTYFSMSRKDYCRLFDELLGNVVGKLDPDRDYWPSSPHSPYGERKDYNNPDCGDAHLWDVWHGKKPFEWYRTCGHRFNSEFGFQSFPEPKTVYGYTDKDDRNVTTAVMEHHQRSGIGNTTIMQYMLEWFLMPSSFEMVLWSSQILQGMAIKYAVEHWRRSIPRGMGTLYWQLNDVWPVASWASVDFHGRWKALHYMARNFFAPVLVSGFEDREKGTVDVHVTSDLLSPLPGKLTWIVTDAAGKRLAGGVKKINTPVNSNRKVTTLKLADLIKKHSSRDLLVWIELTVKGQPKSTNMVTFSRPKHLNLAKKPGITPSIRLLSNGSFEVSLKSAYAALWCWLELRGIDARLSDNFMHLRPGASTKIVVTPAKAMTAGEFRKRLTVSSLVDTH